jgi:U4/U6.U5 tri-snRNP-associated protein 1
LRAKLGLKPLDTGKGQATSSSSSVRKDKGEKTDRDGSRRTDNKESHNKYKDDYGEFYHKPASNIAKTTAAEKLRDKLKEKKEKRALENKLSRNKNLAASDSEGDDDAKKWVKKTRDLERSKKEAEKRAKVLEEMDQVKELAAKLVKKNQKLLICFSGIRCWCIG